MNEREIFLAALDLDQPAKRQAFLATACGGDQQLRQRMEELLQSHDSAASSLAQSALDQMDSRSGESQPDDPDETIAEVRPNRADEKFAFLGPSQRPNALGRLDHYEILELVGRGGFGIVFKAFDEELQRIVAVKVLSPDLATNATSRQRFIREAHNCAAVSHEHLVTIHAVNSKTMPPFLVMQFVAGVSLQDKMALAGQLTVLEVVRIGMQIAAGLAAAHKQGLVHRDIKPANILLENGIQRVKITDFGLARVVDDLQMTQAGTIAGTPQYMSPEQALAQPIDFRSDLFSLGSVMYAMCTGRSAFRAESTVAVLRRVCDDAPTPIRDLNPEIPQWLCDIIERLMAKKPEDRFQSAREVSELLEQHLRHLQQPLTAPPPPPVTPAPQHAKQLATLEQVFEATDIRNRVWQHLLVFSGLAAVMASFPLLSFSTIWLGSFVAAYVLGVVLIVASSRVRQRFQVVYRGHTICFENGLFTGEHLTVDGQVIALGKRINIHNELRGAFRTPDMAGKHVLVLAEAGLVRFRCRMFVEHGSAEIAKLPGAVAWKARLLAVAYALVIVGVLVAGIRMRQLHSRQMARQPQPNPQRQLVGSSENLLDLVQLPADAVAGQWRREENTLVSPAARYARVVVRQSLPQEYELHARVERLEGEHGVGIGIVVGGRQALLVLEGYPENTCGLDLIDGRSAENNETQYSISLLQNQVPIDLVIAVRKDSVRVDVGEKKIIDWQGDPAHLSLADEHAVPDKQALFVESLGSAVKFHSLKLIPLSPAEHTNASDKERLAADWVQKVGGTVELRDLAGNPLALTDGKLPDVPFELNAALFGNNPGITADGLVLLRACKRLDSVQFHTTQPLTDEMLSQLSGAAIRQLWLTNCPALTDNSASTIGSLLGLKMLTLSSPGYSDKAIDDFHPLTEVELFFCPDSRISDDGLARVAQLCPQITHLGLERSPDGKRTVSACRHFPKLQEVGIDGSQLPDEAVAAINAHPTLFSLFMYGPWDDATVKRFAGLKKITAIAMASYVNEADVKLSPTTLRELAWPGSLTTLSFEGSGVSPRNEDLIRLAQLPNLERLALTGGTNAHYTAAGIEKFHQQAAKVTLIVDGKEYPATR